MKKYKAKVVFNVDIILPEESGLNSEYWLRDGIDLHKCNIRQLLALRDTFSSCLEQVDDAIKSR